MTDSRNQNLAESPMEKSIHLPHFGLRARPGYPAACSFSLVSRMAVSVPSPWIWAQRGKRYWAPDLVRASRKVSAVANHIPQGKFFQ